LKWILGALDQYGARLVLGQFPRFYYGNDAGFLNNFRAKKELKFLQRVTQLDQHKDKFNQFIDQGYLTVPNHYEDNLIHTIKRKYEQLIKDENRSLFIGPRIKHALRAIKEPVIDIPELQNLLSQQVQEHIRSYYKTNFQVLHIRCWRTYHIDQKYAKQDVYSNLWHNDPFPITLLRYFVYLSDGVNEKTGALHLHSISNTQKIMRTGYLRRRAIIGQAAKIIDDPKHIIIFSGNMGDGCLMNPQLCLHRAGIPENGKYRDMIQFTLAPAEKPLSPTWFSDLPPDPEGIRM